jgi:hypothetical protein
VVLGPVAHDHLRPPNFHPDPERALAGSVVLEVLAGWVEWAASVALVEWAASVEWAA